MIKRTISPVSVTRASSGTSASAASGPDRRRSDGRTSRVAAVSVGVAWASPESPVGIPMLRSNPANPCATANARRVVQQGRQSFQSRARGNRGRHHLPALAGDPIEHPGRNLQSTIRASPVRLQRRAPACLVDQLVNVNTSPDPGMPWIEERAFLGPVGYCDRVVQCREAAFGPRRANAPRSPCRRRGYGTGGVTETGSRRSRAARLSAARGPPLADARVHGGERAPRDRKGRRPHDALRLLQRVRL